jgi:hypothetical protein
METKKGSDPRTAYPRASASIFNKTPPAGPVGEDHWSSTPFLLVFFKGLAPPPRVNLREWGVLSTSKELPIP